MVVADSNWAVQGVARKGETINQFKNNGGTRAQDMSE